MVYTLRLQQVPREGLFFTLTGAAAEKPVGGRKGRVVPAAYMEFMEGNPLYTATGTLVYFFGCGYTFDGSLLMPGAKTLRTKILKYRCPGILAVMEADSEELISRHRALKLIEALPSLTGTYEDIRKAEDAVRDYASTGKLPRGCLERYPQTDMKDLLGALESFPQAGGTAISPDSEVDFVIADPELDDTEVGSFLYALEKDRRQTSAGRPLNLFIPPLTIYKLLL